MRQRLVILLTLCTIAVVPPGAQTPAPSEESAVRALVERYVDARDARDEAAIASLFIAGVDQYTTAGEWRRGRDRVVAGTAESSRQNPGDRRIDVQAVRFITPDVAIVDGPYIIAGSPLRRWTTIVAQREAGVWRIAAVRNMAPVTAAR